ncbi:MAG: SUMF1/EgtB/PvdO family nonheme iron enzyme [Cyanobacteria bacterium J06639_16]
MADSQNSQPDLKQQARSHQTPPEILRALASRSPNLAQEVALNPHAPIDLLLQFGESRNFYIRRNAAANPAMPVDVLVKLAEDTTRPPRSHPFWDDDDEETIQEVAAGNPSLPLDVLVQLAKQVPYAVTYNPSTPAFLLEQLAQRRHLASAVARHPNAPDTLVVKLAAHRDLHVRWAVARRSPLTPDLIAQLAADPMRQIRAEIAKRTDLSLPLLTQLTRDPDAFVRQQLAQNPLMSAELLGQLAKDEQERVQCEVARHPNTPIPTLEGFAQLGNRRLQIALARNPKAPLSILEPLATHADDYVRVCVSKNPNTPDGLRHLAETFDPDNPTNVLRQGIRFETLADIEQGLKSGTLATQLVALEAALGSGEHGYQIARQALQQQGLQLQVAAYGLFGPTHLDLAPNRLFEDCFESFTFEVVTIDRQGQINHRHLGQAAHFREALHLPNIKAPLAQALPLDLVAIPGGTFSMGSPETELKRSRHREKTPESITLRPFFISRYPITQAQWRTVAQFPKINRNLKTDPAKFKGARRPVEQVSWLEAVEFCDRLAKATDRPYRLPTEAEWEYVCRAGTTTPFHWGETITPHLANYCATVAYDLGPKGPWRQCTTAVDEFGIANAFGLSDMHGNVLEWCESLWHEKPKLSRQRRLKEKSARVLRGGSWFSNPGSCRSASRGKSEAYSQAHTIGFRVVCAHSSFRES